MIAERFPEIAQLPDEDKLILIAELWQNLEGKATDARPDLAAYMEQQRQEYLKYPDRAMQSS